MTHRVPEGYRDLNVEALARVEGEGGMHVRISDDRVTEVRLDIYEPPRFYEAFLQGREMGEPVDITARICGICPIAYQLSACNAIEDACGVTVDGPLRDLRRLIYCGEWIESHALHIYLLHAPDFLGYQSAIEMAADHQDVVEMGLRLRKTGNELITLLGGRESHPINLRLGGFYRVPTERELARIRPALERGVEESAATVRLVAGLDFPDLTIDHELLALREPGKYPIDQGSVASTGGLDFPVQEWPDHVVEEHVERSTALHARLIGRDSPYMVGPLARYALAAHELTPYAAEVAREVGLEAGERNPYRSIVVRSVEMLYAYEEALRLIDGYAQPDRPAVPVPPRAGVGHGATEAPRGILYHRYEIDDDGHIAHATITPPTSQNQRAVEADLGDFVEAHMDLDDDLLQWRCEQAIRNYDPCISCSTHFLDLTVERE